MTRGSGGKVERLIGDLAMAKGESRKKIAKKEAHVAIC